jgi:stage II sporulation protein D
LTLLVPVVAFAAEGDYSIRLAVAANIQELSVKAKDLRLLDADVRDELIRPKDGATKLRAGKEGIEIAGIKFFPRSVIVTGNGSLQIDDRRLTGEVEVAWSANGLAVYNNLPLEIYIEGVIAAEMGEQWPMEALKAQAVAARTFGLRRMVFRQGEDFDVSVGTLDQVYSGIAKVGDQVRAAVEKTDGEVLTYGNIPAETLFHSCCGGRTRSAEEVFGSKRAYLVAVQDPDCRDCPHAQWKAELTLGQLSEMLIKAGKINARIDDVREATSSGGRPGIEMSGDQGRQSLFVTREQLRGLLGSILLSGRFSWQLERGTIRFQGRGYGHGVGMCQWGARGMAVRGQDYRAILKRYYPGCRLRKLY